MPPERTKKNVDKISTKYSTNHPKMRYYTYFQRRFYPTEHTVRSKRLEFLTGINVTTTLFNLLSTAFRQGHMGSKGLQNLSIPGVYSNCVIGRRLEYSISRNQTPSYYTYIATPDSNLSNPTHSCLQVGLNFAPAKKGNGMNQINIVLKYSDPKKPIVTYREQGRKNQKHFSFSYEVNIHLNCTNNVVNDMAPINNMNGLQNAITQRLGYFLTVVEMGDFNNETGNWLLGIVKVPSTPRKPNPQINTYIDS